MNLRSMLRNTVLVSLSVLVLLAIIEAGLYGFFLVTGTDRLNTVYSARERLAQASYPWSPKKYLKIAAFGGSTAWGYAALRPVAAVLEKELETTFPERSFYLRNYARPGAAFHGLQAEIAKRVLPYYDILIIYAGINETKLAIFEAGKADVVGRIQPDLRGHYPGRITRAEQELANPSWIKSLGKTLELFFKEHSRMYALAEKLGYKLRIQSTSEYVAKVRQTTHQPPATADRRVAPLATLLRLRKNFAADLAEIAELARRHGKLLILVTLTTHDGWPPTFSARPRTMSAQDARRFDNFLLVSEKAYQQGRFSAARRRLEDALNLDPKHAYANYLYGMIAMRSKNWATAWKHLTVARDEDGYPMRAHSAFNDYVRTYRGKKRFERTVIVVDMEKKARKIIENGTPINGLFSDIHHPSFLGNVLIGRSVLCALGKIPPYGRLSQRNFCDALSAGEISGLQKPYRALLRVSGGDEYSDAQTNLGWLLEERHLSAHPKKYLEYAVAAWDRINRNPFDRKTNYFAGKAVLSALAGGERQQVEALIKRAEREAPGSIGRMKKSGFYSISGTETRRALEKTTLKPEAR